MKQIKALRSPSVHSLCVIDGLLVFLAGFLPVITFAVPTSSTQTGSSCVALLFTHPVPRADNKISWPNWIPQDGGPSPPDLSVRSIQPAVIRKNGMVEVDWSGIHDRIENTARLRGDSQKVKELTTSIYRNGVETVSRLPWWTTSYDFRGEPPGQIDYYIVHKGINGEIVDISEFNLKEASSNSLVKGSFHGAYPGESFQGAILSPDLQNLGVSPDLTTTAARLGYSKVVWVLAPDAAPRIRQLIEQSTEEVKVEAEMGEDGRPKRITVFIGGRSIQAQPTDFILKVDAAFNGNAFFWDDMLTAIATVQYHPWLAQSTVRFWLMVQKRNGGVIPREVRKSNLISLWWPEAIRYGEKPRPNLNFTNPYLMSWVMDEIYRHDPSAENEALLREVGQSIKDYSRWMENHRSVRDGSGSVIGFNGSALGTGADNSRQRHGNANESEAYEVALVDIISQQIAMYNDLSRWDELLAKKETSGSTEHHRLLDEAREIKIKALALKTVLNERYWDEEAGFYFDLIPDGRGGFTKNRQFMPVAGFWPLFAAAPDPRKVSRIVEIQLQPHAFGGDFPLPANALKVIDAGYVDSSYLPYPRFEDEDGYWDKWARWPPMLMIVAEGFRRVGRTDIAFDLTEKFLRNMSQWSTTTVEECYGIGCDGPRPVNHRPHTHRSDFAGWGKGPPILSYLENWLGLRPSYAGVLNWNVPLPIRSGSEIILPRYIYKDSPVSLSLKKIDENRCLVNVISQHPFLLETSLLSHSPDQTSESANLQIQGLGRQESFTVDCRT